MTASEENKEIDYRLNHMWRGILEIVDDVVAKDYKNHRPIVAEASPGPEGFKQNVSALLTAFPDIDWSIEDVIAEEDQVMARSIGHRTQEGDLVGIEPTGREITLPGVVLFRIDNGHVVERWAQFDTIGMLRQLGVATIPGESSRGSSSPARLFRRYATRRFR